jgi:hypothetical protein
MAALDAEVKRCILRELFPNFLALVLWTARLETVPFSKPFRQALLSHRTFTRELT